MRRLSWSAAYSVDTEVLDSIRDLKAKVIFRPAPIRSSRSNDIALEIAGAIEFAMVVGATGPLDDSLRKTRTVLEFMPYTRMLSLNYLRLI